MSSLKKIFFLGFTSFLAIQTAAKELNSYAGYGFYNTSFKKELIRYPAVLAFFAQLNRIIRIRDGVQINPDCRELTNNNASILGAVDPASGQALESAPGALYFNLYQKCIRHMVEAVSENKDVMIKNQILILGSEFDSSITENLWKQIQFSSLKPELQTSIISSFILFLVGPDTILEVSNYIGEKNAFNKPEIKTGNDLAIFIQSQINSNFSKASLQEVYIIVASLLRLGPGLQI